MRYAARGENAATHYSVCRRACPTRLEHQTSHTLFKANGRADHLRIAAGKTVRVHHFDLDRGISPVRFGGQFSDRGEKPLGSCRTDRIVRCPEPQVLDDVILPMSSSLFGCLCDDCRPELVEFGHSARIPRTARQKTVRDIIFEKAVYLQVFHGIPSGI